MSKYQDYVNECEEYEANRPLLPHMGAGDRSGLKVLILSDGCLTIDIRKGHDRYREGLTLRASQALALAESLKTLFEEDDR